MRFHPVTSVDEVLALALEPTRWRWRPESLHRSPWAIAASAPQDGAARRRRSHRATSCPARTPSAMPCPAQPPLTMTLAASGRCARTGVRRTGTRSDRPTMRDLDVGRARGGSTAGVPSADGATPPPRDRRAGCATAPSGAPTRPAPRISRPSRSVRPQGTAGRRCRRAPRRSGRALRWPRVRAAAVHTARVSAGSNRMGSSSNVVVHAFSATTT